MPRGIVAQRKLVFGGLQWYSGLSYGFAALALASATLGVLIERWLFFAEAEHITMLYYGSEIA